MKTALSVIKNNFYRMLEQKSRFFLLFILSIIAIITAIFVSTNNVHENLGTIVIVSNSSFSSQSSAAKIVYLEQEPPLSELILGKYGAVVTFEDGNPRITTIKSEDYKNSVLHFLNDPNNYFDKVINEESIGTTIIGFLIMFLLMQGLSTMVLFSEDRQQDKMKRIFSSPSSFSGYLFGQVIFTLLLNFLPIFISIFFIKLILPISLGFTVFWYGFLLFIICLLSSAFALFISTFIESADSANMLGSVIIIVTSILSGGFYSFDQNNAELSTFIKVLPQKKILTASTFIENNDSITKVFIALVPVFILIFILFFIAITKMKLEYLPRNIWLKEKGGR